MTTAPAPALSTPPAAPALTVHGSGFGIGRLTDTHAQVTITNPLVHAVLVVDAEQARTLADSLAALADSLTPAAGTAPALVLPPSAGRLATARGSLQ